MNRDRLATWMLRNVVLSTLLIGSAYGQSDATDPNAGRFDGRWVYSHPDWGRVQCFGGCGYPDYGVCAAADELVTEGPVTGRAPISREQGVGALADEWNERTSLDSQAADDYRFVIPERAAHIQGPAPATLPCQIPPEPLADGPIGSGVRPDVPPVTTTPMAEQFGDPHGLQTGYDAAYDEAMCDSGEPASWSLASGVASLATVSRTSVGRARAAASELRTVQAFQRLGTLAFRPSSPGTAAAPPPQMQPQPPISSAGLVGMIDERIVLQAADALDGIGVAISDMASGLRAWATRRRVASLAR